MKTGNLRGGELPIMDYEGSRAGLSVKVWYSPRTRNKELVLVRGLEKSAH